jgi:hypothetical protein
MCRVAQRIDTHQQHTHDLYFKVASPPAPPPQPREPKTEGLGCSGLRLAGAGIIMHPIDTSTLSGDRVHDRHRPISERYLFCLSCVLLRLSFLLRLPLWSLLDDSSSPDIGRGALPPWWLCSVHSNETDASHYSSASLPPHLRDAVKGGASFAACHGGRA